MLGVGGNPCRDRCLGQASISEDGPCGNRVSVAVAVSFAAVVLCGHALDDGCCLHGDLPRTVIVLGVGRSISVPLSGLSLSGLLSVSVPLSCAGTLWTMAAVSMAHCYSVGCAKSHLGVAVGVVVGVTVGVVVGVRVTAVVLCRHALDDGCCVSMANCRTLLLYSVDKSTSVWLSVSVCCRCRYRCPGSAGVTTAICGTL